MALELIRDVGFDPVRRWALADRPYTEPFPLLVPQLEYEGDERTERAYRFERFEKRGVERLM